MANGNRDPDMTDEERAARFRLIRLSQAAVSALKAGVDPEEVDAELAKRSGGEFTDHQQLARAAFKAGIRRELIEEDRAKILEEQGLRPGERGGFESSVTGRDVGQAALSGGALAGLGLGLSFGPAALGTQLGNIPGLGGLISRLSPFVGKRTVAEAAGGTELLRRGGEGLLDALRRQ